MQTYNDILHELGVLFTEDGHHSRPGWLQVTCPHCLGQDHGGINTAYGYYNCWQCGQHSLPWTLHLITDIPYKQIIKLLQDVSSTVILDRPKTGKLVLPKGIDESIDGLPYMHKAYLENRGFDSDELIELWGLRAICLSAKLSWRLFIPITLNHEMVSWTTRALSKRETRYISAAQNQEAIPHKQLLYGEDLTHHAIIVVEGPTDVWRIGPGAVATFGLACTSEQIDRIASHPIRAICFDNSVVAQKRAKVLADTLSLLPGETYIAQLSGDDPDTSPKKEIRQLRKQFLV